QARHGPRGPIRRRARISLGSLGGLPRALEPSGLDLAVRRRQHDHAAHPRHLRGARPPEPDRRTAARPPAVARRQVPGKGSGGRAELLRSDATGPWQVLLKLRVPSALPYIFTAVKVAAPASVVRAIIGEAPSSIQNGLGGEIVVFNQYYTLDPTKLWATNVVA